MHGLCGFSCTRLSVLVVHALTFYPKTVGTMLHKDCCLSAFSRIDIPKFPMPCGGYFSRYPILLQERQGLHENHGSLSQTFY